MLVYMCAPHGVFVYHHEPYVLLDKKIEKKKMGNVMQCKIINTQPSSMLRKNATYILISSQKRNGEKTVLFGR